MPQKGHSPIARLALAAFRRTFDDLLSVQSFVTPFSRSLLENIFEMIMWFGRTKDDYDNFERTARVAYLFLENGSQVKHKPVALKFYAVIDKVIPALNNSRQAQAEANQAPKDNPDALIEKYLAYYKVLYEGLLPIACAPVIYAFSIAKKISDKAFTPNGEGKVDLKTIYKMNKWLAYSENRLAIGLNGHLRNAYAHNNYRILDDEQVELWDRSWGPEIWHLDQLTKICDQLWVNALGIICGLVLYDINNFRVVESCGWVSPRRAPRLRRHELHTVIESIADELGFYLREEKTLPNGIFMSLCVKPKGIDQESELYMGYKSHTDLFKIPMWYEEKMVVDQLIIMLHRLIPYFEVQTEVSINVVSSDDVLLGSLVTDFQALVGLQLKDTKPETVERARQGFKIDTLGTCTTFVEKEGFPRFVGRGPANYGKPPIKGP
ncbi:MAG: hypothetical protein FJ006_10630 [Chloroflexi bacterium]|nr:hypothetical protein [Chloroflexota bacterium]